MPVTANVLVMNKNVENPNKGKNALYIGWGLVVMALIIGPPLSVFLFLIGGPMVIVGARIRRSILPKGVPLSQQPAKSKIIYGGAGAILFFTVSYLAPYLLNTESAPVTITNGLGLFLLAYAVVGVIELKFNKTLSPLSEKWMNQASWKKFIISFVVIIVSIVLAISIMPFIAKVIYV